MDASVNRSLCLLSDEQLAAEVDMAAGFCERETIYHVEATRREAAVRAEQSAR
jgi:hypothetical protein